MTTQSQTKYIICLVYLNGTESVIEDIDGNPYLFNTLKEAKYQISLFKFSVGGPYFFPKLEIEPKTFKYEIRQKT